MEAPCKKNKEEDSMSDSFDEHFPEIMEEDSMSDSFDEHFPEEDDIYMEDDVEEYFGEDEDLSLDSEDDILFAGSKFSDDDATFGTDELLDDASMDDDVLFAGSEFLDDASMDEDAIFGTDDLLEDDALFGSGDLLDDAPMDDDAIFGTDDLLDDASMEDDAFVGTGDLLDDDALFAGSEASVDDLDDALMGSNGFEEDETFFGRMIDFIADRKIIEDDASEEESDELIGGSEMSSEPMEADDEACFGSGCM